MKTNNDNREYAYKGSTINGFAMLAVVLLLIPALAGISFTSLDRPGFAVAVLALLWTVCLCGFFIQQPNQARVMIFFGKYRGTLTATGFYWVNPFMTTKKVSLRLHNIDVEPIKAHDNAALEAFVRIQSDAALREVTGHFAYDNIDGMHDEITLRGGGEEINDLLEKKINERLAMAGIEVVEARINYLAYAPEIAAVMLRRQQAAAIISAREKIVEGAVSMVRMALKQLEDEQVVELDAERKAAMVSNMLVVLCADEPAQPVLNTGSLYQ